MAASAGGCGVTPAGVADGDSLGGPPFHHARRSIAPLYVEHHARSVTASGSVQVLVFVYGAVASGSELDFQCFIGAKFSGGGCFQGGSAVSEHGDAGRISGMVLLRARDISPGQRHAFGLVPVDGIL